MHGRGGATSAQAAAHGPSSFEARPAGAHLRMTVIGFARLEKALQSGLDRRRLPRLRALWLVDRDEIDGVEQERREAAADDGGRDDLAREREEHTRAFDHDQRADAVLRNALEMKYARIGEVEGEQGR